MGGTRTPLFRSTVRVGPARKVAASPAPKQRYETEEDLGKGGMGRVARGVDRFLGRPVAFKRSLEGDPQMLEALLHEAEIAARLDHPSIVTIHDVAHDEHDEPFVVMRLVDGQPLSAVLEGTDLAARLRLLPRIVSAIEAVAYAHTQGVVHRDLKPDNILVANRGDTVVIDWGLALDLRAERDPFEGASVGTPGFIAPEQARGERADPRVDVYALGVTLFYVLGGKLPGDTPPSLATVAPGVPADLVTIVDKACALDRDVRYPTATELAADLDRFIGGQLVAAHRYGVGQRAVRWIKQHRIGVAIAAVAIAASGTFGLVSRRRGLAARARAEHEGELARAAERRATERADQLIVDRARAAAHDDPARAIALLDLRASPKLDADARMVSIEAIAQGLPHSWRAHTGLVTRIAPLGGDRFVSAGFEGNVLLHDGARGSKLVANYGSPLALLAEVTGGFVVKANDTVDHYDTHGIKLASWTATAGYAEASGTWIATYDDQRRGIVRTLDGTTSYPLVDAVEDLAFDARQRWLALAQKTGVQILDLATGTRRTLATGETRQVVFSPTGHRLLAVRTDQQIEEWSTQDWTRVDTFASDSLMFGYIGPNRASFDRNGCVWLELRGTARKQLHCYAVFSGAFAAADGWFLVGAGRELTMFHGDAATRLAGAADPVLRLATDPTRRYVFAGTRGGYLTIWDTHARGVTIDHVDASDAITIGDALIVDQNARLARIDRDGTRSVLADITTLGVRRVLFEVGGQPMVFYANGPLFVIRDGRAVPAFEGSASDVVKRGTNELLILTTDGKLLWIEDVAGRQGTELADDGKVAMIGGSEEDRSMAVAYADGRLWWQPRDNVIRRARIDCKPARLRPTGDDLVVGCGTTLYLVRGDGTVTEVLRTQDPIADWERAGDRWLVVTTNGAVWRFERGVATKLVGESSSDLVALGRTRFATIERAGGTIWLHDVASESRVPLGRILLPSGLWLAADGRSLIVIGRGEVFRWTDPTPATDADWKTWRRRLTRATLSEPNAALQWP